MVMRVFGLVVLMTWAACASGGDDPIGELDQEARIRVCPAIAILCIEGYKPKQLPNCNQICVPDHGTWECDEDVDCGGIYCITSPCPTVSCQGHKCVTSTAPTPPGETCGDTTCGAGSYCCNSSCGICAPDGGACIQIACGEEL